MKFTEFNVKRVDIYIYIRVAYMDVCIFKENCTKFYIGINFKFVISGEVNSILNWQAK